MISAGVLSNGALAAKARGMRGKLLTKQQYEQMAAQKTVAGGVAYLKSTPSYRDILAMVDENKTHREQIENILRGSLIADYLKFRKFVNINHREFLRGLFIRYDIYYLKLFIQVIMEGEKTQEVLASISKEYLEATSINIARFENVQDMQGFLDVIKGTRYHRVLSSLYQRGKEPTLFEMENQLDIYFFTYVSKSIKKALSGSDKEALEKYLGSEADMLNLLWIYRCKQYYLLPNEVIYGFLVPVHYKLTVQKIKELTNAKTMEEFMDFASATPYSAIFRQKSATFEKTFLGLLIKLLKIAMQNDPYTIISAVGYLNAKELEIENIFSVIEGLRYNLSTDAIMEYIYMP